MKRMITLLILSAVLLLSGCGGKKEPSDSDMTNLTAAMDAFIQEEISSGESLPLIQRIQNDILREITYEIRSYDIAKGTMTVEFTYVDVLALADGITDPNLTEDTYYRHCIERISCGQCSMITEEIQVSFTSSAEGYTVIGSEALTNVLSGGVLRYYLELLEGIGYE